MALYIAGVEGRSWRRLDFRVGVLSFDVFFWAMGLGGCVERIMSWVGGESLFPKTSVRDGLRSVPCTRNKSESDAGFLVRSILAWRVGGIGSL